MYIPARVIACHVQGGQVPQRVSASHTQRLLAIAVLVVATGEVGAVKEIVEDGGADLDGAARAAAALVGDGRVHGEVLPYFAVLDDDGGVVGPARGGGVVGGYLKARGGECACGVGVEEKFVGRGAV